MGLGGESSLLLSISSIGTMIFSVWGNWGLWKQNQAIWHHKSGKSVSVNYFTFNLAYFLAGFVYGFSSSYITMIIHCLGRFIFHIPILIGLWKFKGFKYSEYFFLALFLFLVVLSIFPQFKALVFLIYSLGMIGTYVLQPLEIFQNKDAGTVEPELHMIYFGSGLSWTMYGFATGDLILILTTPVSMLISVVTIIFCYKYKAQPRLCVSP